MVVCGRHLDDVGPDKVESVEAAHHLQQLATGEAADLRSARAGRVRGVEDIDVDGHVERMVADRLPQLRNHVGDGTCLKLAAVHDGESEFGVRRQVVG
jgi:hypothetical protein